MADYRNLDVWQQGRSIVTTAYRFTELLPEAEKDGLIQQIKSAAIAVPSAIADGAGRGNDVQFLRLIQDALGAISALDTLVLLAADLEYVEEFHTHDLEKRTKELALKLRAMAQKIESEAFGVRRRQFDGPRLYRRDEEGGEGGEGGGDSEERPRRPYQRRTEGSEDRPQRPYRRDEGSPSGDERPRRTYRRSGDDAPSGGDDRPARRSYRDTGGDDRPAPRRSYGDRPSGDRPAGGGGYRGGSGGRPSGGGPSSGGPRGGGSSRGPSGYGGGSRGPGRPPGRPPGGGRPGGGGDRPPRKRRDE